MSAEGRHLGKIEGSTEIVGQSVDPSENTSVKSHWCNHCSEERYVNSLKRCGGCKAVYYCSNECQREHWHKHKVLCNAISFLAKKKNDSLCGTYVSHITPKNRAKIIRLVGSKCTVKCNLQGVPTVCLYDTGAQICLLSDVWLRENYPSLLIRPIKDLLDDHELVVKTATDEDIPFEGYVEIDFQLDGYESDNYLRVPFLVTTEKISEPIIGFNVIQEIACNPHQYGLDFEDLVKILEQSMPTAKDVPAVIDLFNDRSIVDLCQVKTTTRGITIPPRKNLIIKCYANTGHVDCCKPVMIEPDPKGCWPEGL